VREKYDVGGRGSGNSRNGTRTKTVLTDITEHPTAEGKPYLCAVKDRRRCRCS
jgi:hypothetical protein